MSSKSLLEPKGNTITLLSWNLGLSEWIMGKPTILASFSSTKRYIGSKMKILENPWSAKNKQQWQLSWVHTTWCHEPWVCRTKVRFCPRAWVSSKVAPPRECPARRRKFWTLWWHIQPIGDTEAVASAYPEDLLRGLAVRNKIYRIPFSQTLVCEFDSNPTSKECGIWWED